MASYEEMLRRAKKIAAHRSVKESKPFAGQKTAERRRLEGGRCPLCRGDEVEGKVRNGGKPCWLSTCPCMCHARLRGMGRGVTDATRDALLARAYAKNDPWLKAPMRRRADGGATIDMNRL